MKQHSLEAKGGQWLADLASWERESAPDNREQLERLRTAVSGGKTNATGFGLMNVQKRVQLEYGAAYGLEIDSAPGQGTTVTLHLPARPYGA